MSDYKAGDEVTIPSSHLGSEYGIGKIIAIWNGKMKVDFSGHIGIYTIDKHTIERAKNA